MSRSRKKIPIVGMTTAETDKPFKEREHRRERRRVRVSLRSGDAIPHPKQFGNPWASEKDGKQYWNNPRALRK